MKKYEVSFNNKRYNSKPSGNEIGKISNGLYTKCINYKEMAYEVGEHGCTFSPAIYDGKRRKENYVGQQLIGLDFDNGVTFSESKNVLNTTDYRYCLRIRLFHIRNSMKSSG